MNYSIHKKQLTHLSALLLLAAATAVQAEKARPNVVIIYGDDVGYGDVGVNGAVEIPTPHIDAFAAEGLNFTDGHAAAATCTPSRFAMLTGVHAFRYKVHIAPPNEPLLIPTDALTLPGLFKRAGYHTGVIGKWHLGLGDKETGPQWNDELKPGPLELGFDQSFLLPTTNDRVPCVYVDGHRVVNLDPNDPIHVGDLYDEVNQPGSTAYRDLRAKGAGSFYKSEINGIGRIGYMSGGKAALWDDYTMADLFVGKAKTYIAEHKAEPFFLYFSSQDVHIPNAPAARFQGKTTLGARGDAMVQFDWAAGEILQALEDHGLSENTIVIVSSDNGPTHHHDSCPANQEVRKISPLSGNGHDASGPWRGGKYEIYEGATRVPLMIRWPGHIEPGQSDALVSQVDFIASFAKLLGLPLAEGEARDSRDTLAAFLGEDRQGQSYILEECRNRALRAGKWKYIKGMPYKWSCGFGPVENSLYHLADDPGEQVNLISMYPEKAAEMERKLKELNYSKGLRP